MSVIVKCDLDIIYNHIFIYIYDSEIIRHHYYIISIEIDPYGL